MKKFESHKKKRPVSESKVLNRGRRRSKVMDILAMNYEKNSNPSLTNDKISKILKESKMISFGEDSVQPFLETRSNIDKSETRNKKEEEVTYTITPIYPEQIYFNKVSVEGEQLEKEKERRLKKFGALGPSNLNKMDMKMSISPVKMERGGKKLIAQSSIDQKLRKGAFMTPEESADLFKMRDKQFVEKMKDTQGNAIQRMKHAFLNQDDRKLRKKLLDALRKKFSKMIVKDKTVEELKEIYDRKENEEKTKRVKDWMAVAKSSHMEGKNGESNIFEIGKINRNLVER
jgi:DNA-binding transcriptional regulator YhcF (GntR family)